MLRFIISRNGRVLKTLENQKNEYSAMGWLLSYQPFSIHWAITNEGYEVEQINEETGERLFWSHPFKVKNK